VRQEQSVWYVVQLMFIGWWVFVSSRYGGAAYDLQKRKLITAHKI